MLEQVNKDGVPTKRKIVEIEISQEIVIPARAEVRRTRILWEYTHRVNSKIEAKVLYLQEDGTPDFETLRGYTIMGEDYQSLLEANPSWAPNKPEGVFRPSDILTLISVFNLQ